MRVCAITGPLCGQHVGRSGLGGGGINPRSSGQFAGTAPCPPKEPVVTLAAAGSDSSGAGRRFAVLSPGGNSSLAMFSWYSAREMCAFSRSDFSFEADLGDSVPDAGAFGAFRSLRGELTLSGGGKVGSPGWDVGSVCCTSAAAPGGSSDGFSQIGVCVLSCAFASANSDS